MKEFDYAVEALNAGADYFMRKAIDHDDLNSVIGRDKGFGAADWICRNTTYSVYKSEADTPLISIPSTPTFSLTTTKYICQYL